MAKIYEYDGLLYCETDLSLEVANYGGDLYDLYWQLRQEGKAHEETTYYAEDFDGDYATRYDSAEDLIENEFSELDTGREVEDE